MKSISKLGLLIIGMAAASYAQTGYGGLGYGLGPYGGTGLPSSSLMIKGGKWGMAGALVGSFTIAQSPTLAPLIPCGPDLPAAQLPQLFADDREVDPPNGVYDVTKTMGVDYTANSAGLNQAILDWKNAADQWWHVIVPHGTLGTTTPLTVTSKVSLLGKVGATKFLVFDSDTPLPEKVTVCSHKTIDNSDGSSPRNFQCTNDKGAMGAIEGATANPGNNGLLFQACQVGIDANCTVGPNHIALKNLELRPAATSSAPGFMIVLDDGDTTGTNGSSHIWLKYNYLHGDASEAGTGTNKITTVIRMAGCSFCGLAYNYVDQVVSLGSESHIVGTSWSNGPDKYVHNWFEGSSINWFTGGSASTLLPYQNVYDQEVRGNRFTKPAAWLGLATSSQIVDKNAQEVKTCSRCWFDGNIYENINTSGAQKGQCFTMTPRSGSAGLQTDNYSTSINDITWTNNICRHAVTGIEASSRSDYPANGGGVAQPGKRWNIQNDLFYDISPGNPTIYNTTVNIPFVIESGGGWESWNATAVRDATGTIATLTLADGPTIVSATRSSGTVTATVALPWWFTSLTQGVLLTITGSSDPTFDCIACTAKAITSGAFTMTYPSTGANGSSTGGAASLTGLHQTSIAVGDPVNISKCSDTSFNTPIHNTTFFNEGPAALTGTLSFVLNAGSQVPGPVVYTNSGAAFATATGCLVSNGQGYQQGFSARHLTIIGGFVGSSGGHGQVPSCNVPDSYGRTFTFQDNLVAPLPTQYDGLKCQSVFGAEGTVSENSMADPASFVFNHNALVGRNASNYTDYPGATNPSTGNWFPANVACPGTGDATCFGFKGMLNGVTYGGSTYEANAVDYHDYVLDSTSVFKAGGSQQASDSTAVGADIPTIDLHLNATQGICQAGGSGPFPD